MRFRQQINKAILIFCKSRTLHTDSYFSSYCHKMRLLTDNGKCRLPFEFNEKTVTLKVTRYTTFHDVVHMLTHKAGIPKSSARLYAVYECTTDIERKIGGEGRVLNIWKSWGCETSNFRFVVKLTDSKVLLEDFRSSPFAKSEEEIDRLLSQRYRKANACMRLGGTTDFSNIIRCRSDQNQIDPFNQHAIKTQRHGSIANIASKLDCATSSYVSTPIKIDCRPALRNNESGGKRAFMTKYLKDLKLFSKRKSKQSSQTLDKREQADGAEIPEDHMGRYVEGKDDPDVRYTSDNLMVNCRYHWEVHCHYDDDSDSKSSKDFLDSVLESDQESDVLNTSSLALYVRALDRAFVQSARYSESDEGIDVTDMTSSDLNIAFVANVEHQCATDEEYSELGDSVDDFDKNISTSDYVRKLFGADDIERVSSQDDEVDSFMRSRLGSL